MTRFIGYRCSLCNAEYLPGQVTYTCPKEGGQPGRGAGYRGHPPEIPTRRPVLPKGRVAVALPLPAAPASAGPERRQGSRGC
jgi:hypothetical protein